MLFSTTPNDLAFELMMRSVPNHSPRGYGLYVFNKFKYSVADCDCRYCMYCKKRSCTLPECCCIEERVRAHAIGFPEFMKHTLCLTSNPFFQSRLNKYIKESENCHMVYRGSAHEKAFLNAVSEQIDCDNKMTAALYLLTADRLLWSKARRCICNSQIHFSAVNLGNTSPEAYALFMTAMDLYKGTRHITLSDIADRELISHKMFELIVNAMAIRRYGADAVAIISKGGGVRC